MKKRFWQFWHSKRKKTYFMLAYKYRVAPWRVYNLAHGSSAHSRKDDKILNDLKELGIITAVNHW